MIHFLVGKPRNGKSLRAVMFILEQLMKTQRYIPTNIVLDIDEIQRYLDKRGFNIHARNRIKLLTDEETRNFWLHREGGYVIPTPKDYDDKKGDGMVDYSPLFELPQFREAKVPGSVEEPNLKGTCYVIDEIHTHWPARGWQGTPRHADFYCSQHGKLNDLCYFITQNTKLVDPNFYRLAQDFTYCTNGRLQKFGRFRGGNKFTAKTYPGPVQSSNEVTMNVEDYPLDLEIAACYDTSAGVGMPGGGSADKGFRVPGVSLKWVWVALGLAICGVYYVFNYVLPQIGSRYLTAGIKHGTTDTRVLDKKGGTLEPSSRSQSVPAKSVNVTPPPLPSPVGPDVFATGWIKQGERIMVSFSDGTILTEEDRELQRVERHSVIVSGRRIPFKRSPSQVLERIVERPAKPQDAPTQAAPVADYKGESLMPASADIATLRMPARTDKGQ